VHRSDRISERLSFSSMKYGPSVRAAVRTQLLPVVVSVVGSVTPAVELVEQAPSVCETTTVAAAPATLPNSSRLLRGAAAEIVPFIMDTRME